MKYYIYHPNGGSMNHDCVPAQFMYNMVYKLEANSFEEAFKMSQNDFNEDYASKGYRSTSVGDIIMSDEDYDNNRCHLVKGNGFQDVPSTWLSYIDWGVVDYTWECSEGTLHSNNEECSCSHYDYEERYDRAHNPAESWDGDNSPCE